jgi:hypothetical protein
VPSEISAFIDLGDQFLALQKGRTQPADDDRHFGLVVHDKNAVRKALADAGIEPLPGPFLEFLDPWGNRIEIACAAWQGHRRNSSAVAKNPVGPREGLIAPAVHA